MTKSVTSTICRLRGKWIPGAIGVIGTNPPNARKQPQISGLPVFPAYHLSYKVFGRAPPEFPEGPAELASHNLRGVAAIQKCVHSCLSGPSFQLATGGPLR